MLRLRSVAPPVLAALLFSAAAPAQGPEWRRLENGLEIDLALLPGFEPSEPDNKQVQAAWSGKLGDLSAYVSLWVLPPAMLGMDEPDGLDQRVLEVYKGYEPVAHAIVPGGYGWASYASLTVAENAARKRDAMFLCGLLEHGCYFVIVDAYGRLAADQRSQVERFLRQGVGYRGPVRDARWTDAEAQEFWAGMVMPELGDRMKPPIRTAHYVVLTDGDEGAAYAALVERNHERIREAFPFPEVEGRRLLPVLLFASREEHLQFYMRQKKGTSRTMAESITGHAMGTYYATSDDDPADPAHIHEATHQVFENRLLLSGGGSWFQEGVADYMCTTPEARGEWARAAASTGKYVPFAQLVKIERLSAGLGRSFSGPDLYKQACSIVAFLRESPARSKAFEAFVHAAGRLPKQDPRCLDAALDRVYGTDLAGLEKEWKAWWTSGDPQGGGAAVTHQPR